MMRFDIYGRYMLDVERVKGSWTVLRVQDGKRRPEPDIVIPKTLVENDIIEYLEDLLHEHEQPGEKIRRI